MQKQVRRFATVIALAGAVDGVARQALAVDHFYSTNASSGFWSTAISNNVNWSPVGVPQPSNSEVVYVDHGGDGTVIFDYNYPINPLYSVRIAFAGNGVMTVDHTQFPGTMNTTYMDIGENLKGQYLLGQGELLTRSSLYVGSQANGAGTLAMSNIGDAVSNYVNVGNNGSGTITQSGASAHSISGGMDLGYGISGIGYYGISNGTLLITGGGLTVGNAGVGTFAQSGGVASLNAGAALNVGSAPTAVGRYTLSAGTFNSYYENIGYQGIGTFTQTGGVHSQVSLALGGIGTSSGAYSLSAGTETLSQNCAFGSGAGTSGTYSLSGSGYFSVGGSTQVGSAGIGTFNQNGGTSTFTGMEIGSGVGASGTVSLSLGTMTVNGDLSVGNAGTATFAQSGGVASLSTGAVLNIGSASTGVGRYTLGAGTLNSYYENLGYAGSGSFIQTGGMHAQFSLALGLASGGGGAYSLSAGTETVSQNFYVGYAAGANGTYTLSGTGYLSVAGTTIIGQSGNGSFNQSGGTIANVGDTYIGVDGNGSVSQSGGALNSAHMYAGTNAGSTGRIAMGGGTISNSADTFIGYTGAGTLNQSAGVMSTASIYAGVNPGGAGTIILSGGTLSTSVFTIAGQDGAGTIIQSGGTLNSGSDIQIGAPGRGTFNMSGGYAHTGTGFVAGAFAGSRGFIHLSNGAAAVADQACVIGGDAYGSLVVDTGASLLAGSLFEVGLRSAGNGHVDILAGGSVTVNSGPGGGLILIAASSLTTGQVAVSGAGAQLSSAGQLQVGARANFGSLAIGPGGLVTSGVGASLTSSSGILGNTSIAVGEVDVTGGTWNNAGTLNVGWDGRGIMNLLQGGVVTSVGGIVARDAGSGGTVVIGGAGVGSRWSVTDSLTIGGAPGLPGGDGSVTLSSGGKLQVGNLLQVHPTGTVIFSGGQLDLTQGAAIFDYTGADPLANIVSKLQTGYSSGAWTGVGINSSTAAAVALDGSNPHKTALGYARSTDLFSSFPATFKGQAVDNTTILIAYVNYGDANLNGSVDTTDFTILAANFSGSNRRWSQGDFNYDASVDTTDFTLLASNFGQFLAAPDPSPGLGILIPEPAALAGVIGFTSLLRRRRSAKLA